MALKSFRDRNKITVGVVSTGLLALLVASVYLVGTEGLLRDRYAMSGIFTDTGGLRAGDEVRVAGVAVGEVTEVRPDWTNGRVLVAWEVDSDVDLGTGTRAEVQVATVLGGRYLRLSGPVAAPHMADLPEDRRRIPVERTAVPTTFNDVLKTSTRAVRRLDTRSIQTIVAELGGLSERDRGRLSRALTNLTELAETVNESDPQIRKLLDNGERLVALADSKERQLLTLMNNVQAMLDELELRRDELSAFLGGGDATVTAMTRLIDRQQDRLKSIIKDLQTTLAALRPASDEFNALLAWAGPTLSGLSSVGGRGPWLDVVATGLGPLSPEDLAGLARLARQQGAAR
ncbi:phospholipid/cholesterol/gamma-HCH transport system substrate-binding protein [Actinomadura cellulosilytica]|uniref:Phospholipid/cholesterol/gamma-HCH transport system substrate-binding protein n=2 Tax=Thermomonospora cellulosilytica TaxID=1411118 RepID=A0A7W3MW03_9ACTN|nr:phospholipid/cholesterol/gamma-HCH transport system substrate-binding protein [Thermomonospora cellulosilytica]